MARMQAKTTIDATPKRVWEVLSDFGGISLAAAHLTGSALTTEQVTGVGAARHCDIDMAGRSTEEVVTRWEDGITVLTGVMSYEMPGGPVGRLMERLGSNRMTGMRGGMMASFKERAETGNSVGNGTRLPLEAVRVS